MSLVGSIERFNLNEDNWFEYVERMEQYFIANGIDANEKRRHFVNRYWQ